MSEHIIPETEQRKRQTFTTEFYKYISEDSDPAVYFHFKNVRDENKNMIKENFKVEHTKALHLIGELEAGKEVSFTARIVVDERSFDGFDFADIKFQDLPVPREDAIAGEGKAHA